MSALDDPTALAGQQLPASAFPAEAFPDAAEDQADLEAARGRMARFDALLIRLGERLNPILVKESRQALKSKQFSITFGLVLLFGWVWSMLGVAIQGPSVYYNNSGPDMFAGYYVILAFPLLVIVPFSAFRSLAAEREDGTYELLSITTLLPRQVIGGKMGSAVLQMVVYLSAMTPFLAFTYMLRGIDFPTILLVIYYTVMTSLGLSLAGLMLATVSSEKHWQVVLSVFVIFGLGFAFLIACSVAFTWLEGGQSPFQDEEFWLANAAIATAFVSYFALFYCAAAAQLTFASDNRSTRLRVVMVAQQAILFGWMVFFFARWPQGALAYVFLTLVGLHWFLMGAFMTGESPWLSPRARRGLPQTFLGRALFTWFNPGPCTGYVFALANLATCGVLTLSGMLFWATFFPTATPFGLSFDWMPLADFTVLGFCYVAIYLGVGRLLASLANRFVSGGILVSLLFQVILLLTGSLGPLVVHMMSTELRGEYSLLEITNPLYTLVEIGRERTSPDQRLVLMTALPAAALLVLLLNLRGILSEVRLVRAARPDRVEEEDAQQRAIDAPPREVQISPWDFEVRQA
jgi:hypothetical protein